MRAAPVVFMFTTVALLLVVPAMAEAPAAGPEQTLISAVDRVEIADEAQRVSAVLRTLRPEQQKVLELSLVHGRSHSQISEQTGMPLGTVKSLARRGLMKVRRALGVDPLGSGAELSPDDNGTDAGGQR